MFAENPPVDPENASPSPSSESSLDELRSPAPLIDKRPTAGIIFNPISGNGRSANFAAHVAAELGKRGYDIRMIRSEAVYDHGSIQEFLRSVDHVVIAGGDGTVMGLLPHAAESQTPVYALRTGNESLFSQEFNMSRRPSDVADRLERNSPTPHRFGEIEIDGTRRPFFLMATLGFDSKVVSEVSGARTSPVGHVGYIMPGLEVLLNFEPPRINLMVDGEEKLKNVPGYLIVANSSRYALNLKLVPEAKTTSDQLCARFFPAIQKIEEIVPGIKALLNGQPFFSAFSRYFSGSRFEVSVENPGGYEIQADGDAIGKAPAVIEMDPRVLLVHDG